MRKLGKLSVKEGVDRKNASAFVLETKTEALFQLLITGKCT